MFGPPAVVCLWLVLLTGAANAKILTPPYFNLAQGRRVSATATCGEDTGGPELYCKLVGPTNAENDVNTNVIQGQHCDECDPSKPKKNHRPENAVDGKETWWQSPPLSRGMKYNEVNFTIDLGQEFHVAYVYVKMGNSPRPGLWVLEKSVDYGKTFSPWQYFGESRADCMAHFGDKSLDPITKDDSVICTTDYSKIVPLEGGEIPIPLLKDRPSASHYFNSSVLQEWTRATNVRLRMLRTKNLYGHLMFVATQDTTVTRRFFYSIKDISIGGRCMCNGHADSCDNRETSDPGILVCGCRHNTCGSKCDSCCPGFEQKAWRQSKSSAPFECEPCNCFDHSNECIYDAEVDKNQQSLDIHGKYDGGGVCQNCQHNTEGINCNRCKTKFYKPYSKHWNETDVCHPCDCDKFYSTGDCEEGSGRCTCRPEYQTPNCDSCSFGYYGYPECKSCECYLNGTLNLQCEQEEGTCNCKNNFGGSTCGECADEFYNFPECEPCECNPLGAISSICDKDSGTCTCKSNYGGKQCSDCQHGYFNYPSCTYCQCDVKGTQSDICDKESGKCICKEGYGGERCDQCVPGYFGYPECKPCNCSQIGSQSVVCDTTGKCPCLSNFAGRTCNVCSPGYYNYPECLPCNCDDHGSNGITCNSQGICQCHYNFDGTLCNRCKDGFYNFPSCEECNCNPAGVVAAFAGCGSVPKGELCLCKDRVEGRICDKCKPLYWNLNTMNPEGCVECKCHEPGILGGIAVCDRDDGQCMCKPSVVARGCSECDDGTYNLRKDNLFGCTDCQCDVGGSVGPVCEKSQGQCHCQPRITGRTCNEPIQAHYFPTLYQYQFEVEDGTNPDLTNVRYYYNETEFPGYSWKGYAVFSPLQREVILEINIYKPSLYRMVIRYVNKHAEAVTGTIKIIPDNPQNAEQKHSVIFKSSEQPSFETVSMGNIPNLFVMDTGKWNVSITINKDLLIDYFVLLPEEYYMARILNQKVLTPCTIDNEDLCRMYSYPNTNNYHYNLGLGGYIDIGGGAFSMLTEYYDNFNHLNHLNLKDSLPMLNENQNTIDYNITVAKPGKYVVLVNYITRQGDESSYTVGVKVLNNNDVRDYNGDRVEMYNCPYSFICRQVVVKDSGVVGVYNVDDNLIHIRLHGENTNVGIQSIVVLSYEEWSLDFIKPSSVCIMKDGECTQSSFIDPQESKKIIFKKEAIVHDGKEKMTVSIANTTYVYMNHDDKVIDVRSKVPSPGFYSFIVHYHQPEFAEYDIDILVQNGMFYVGKLPVKHCPSTSGCRALVVQKDGNTKISLTENFMITLKVPKGKEVYLNYLLVVPHDFYNDRILEEEALDRTGEFIKNCGKNHFDIDVEAKGFCRDSVFSITSGYNNGALNCQCDYDGSLSFECDTFGGQCQCKPNVIGRQCSICQTGFYGFPDCKPCNCSSTSTCDPNTGDCICPPNVVGKMCNECDVHTYGYDSFSGCQECKCNPLGVDSLQCDINKGNCPYNIHEMDNWSVSEVIVNDESLHIENINIEMYKEENSVTIDLADEFMSDKTVYFSAPDVYLGKQLTSYGGYLNYTISYTIGDLGKATMRPDIILEGANNYLVHNGYEQPPVEQKYVNLLEIVESNFQLPNGVPAKREDLMMILKEVKGIYIRATYWSITETSKLENVYLDNAVKSINASGFFDIASSVEDCDCPINYQGFSCEECAPGNYRKGEYCVPCNCNGHADECDVNTGICLNCSHNTYGDHCEMCEVGYYGNALHGTPRDCLICACPLPIASNNFATGCEVTPDGEKISCECRDGYNGARCQSCAPGYYGRPEVAGDYCKKCECSGNINFELGSCDTVTGECLKCLNNTFGEACRYCAPGFFGDAVTLKNCQNCICHEDGYEKCDNDSGTCICKKNVVGEKCDRCEVNHYGFQNGEGCDSCNCFEASKSSQCDDTSGQCSCKPGVTGRMCDKCESGFWNYTSEGCVSCGCKNEYSLGFGCNAETGQCECLPGVIGDKCDKCPYRWTFVQNYGCFGCDSCIHDLLNFTDELGNDIDPILDEFNTAQSGYFTARKLVHINDTINELKPKVLQLSPDQINLKPILKELESMEQDSNNMNRKVTYSLDNSYELAKEAGDIAARSLEMFEKAEMELDNVQNTIADINDLANNLDNHEGPKIDTALEKAEEIMNTIKSYNLSKKEEVASDKLNDVLDLLKRLENYKEPVDVVNDDIMDVKDALKTFNMQLDDLANQTQYSLAKSKEAKELYDKNGMDRLKKKLDNIKMQTEETEKNLIESRNYINNASKLLNATKYQYDDVHTGIDEINDLNVELNMTLETSMLTLDKVRVLEPQVMKHANELSDRAQALDNMLRETRTSSENAVKAATAYNEINKAIDAARSAAESSKEQVDDTVILLQNIEMETLESDEKSSTLLDDAHDASKNIKELIPNIEDIKNKSRPIRALSDRNDEQLKNLIKKLENFQINPVDDILLAAKENAEEADTKTAETLQELNTGFQGIGNLSVSSKQLPIKLYDASRDRLQVIKQLETLDEKLPEIVKSIRDLPSMQSHSKLTGDIESKINKLNEQIALARDIANRIEVGVKFNPSTTLELRNPDNLGDLSTSTQISGYFRTEKPNGLLLYVGNGKGTNLRRTKSDDYMALEIENGYPVLTLDLGNDAERIINDKYVSDNNWYQFIIDRTGLNAKLTIKEELNGKIKETVADQQLEGPYSIFNLDKNYSKIFVGSYPLEFKMQDKVMQNSFEGEVEGLVIGETPVSLWNFNKGYDNNQGAQERDKLKAVHSTGCRFNGNGYAIVNSRSYQLRGRSTVQLKFKTFASEGLMFLYGNEKTFISLELRNGKILYKYNLGSGTKIWHTSSAFNDGIWHTIEASRDGAKGRFVVDGIDVVDNSPPIFGNTLEHHDTVFFGGYPQMHNIKEVTNIDFDGCMDNVIIMRHPVDLTDNIKAYGVTPGCPEKFSRLVSFHPNIGGFVKNSNISSSNDFRMNLKFKTKAKNGMIFYVTDRNHDSVMYLALQDGRLKLVSQNIELISNENNFNDNEWHVVSIRHNNEALKLDFDDYGYKMTDSPPTPLNIQYGDVFFGGLPRYLGSSIVTGVEPFAGCIGDATINGKIINFANLTEKYGEQLGKCILDKEIGSDSDIHIVPVLPPLEDFDVHTTTEALEHIDSYNESDIPKRGDGGIDTGGSEEEDLPKPEEELEDDLIPQTTTPWPTPRPRPTVTTETPSACALPIDPKIIYDDHLSGSYRYGTEKDSRLEYNTARGKYRKQFDFNLEFKTLSKNGIIFYVADNAHHNFVSLFMLDGELHYTFNIGTGPAKIVSKVKWNDNVWHEVMISREGLNGKLVIDNEHVVEGKAPGHATKMELFPPYYLGGVAPKDLNSVMGNLNMSDPFVGCIRNFQMNNKAMENPDSHGVIPCSDNVEQGVFFSSRGGYVKLKERFKVGTELDVKMDIKPRNLSGLIMAVHGRRDYFVLELDEGALRLTVDNGKGPIITRYQPTESHLFCDGHWHSIQAVKSKSVVTLAVNGVYSSPGIGDHKSASTDTGGYLFLGGHRLINKAKGLTVRIPYVGCIRNVLVNNIVNTITPNMVEGGITIGSCPTN
ncbi:PREDICTED: laminin subunit alpha isoform X2 [Nicrophorus vespilloides]|uniref:Laminin subunit alpha isoform X2 n=1 Tax=Nicrophorus vespilloides TaxID=110193 RepID=A0ABM1MWU3_NICVS|nr:PREDICTED: laminin subunit alpha isoform X2 [Nicrophorus vespilloides]